MNTEETNEPVQDVPEQAVEAGYPEEKKVPKPGRLLKPNVRKLLEKGRLVPIVKSRIGGKKFIVGWARRGASRKFGTRSGEYPQHPPIEIGKKVPT